MIDFNLALDWVPVTIVTGTKYITYAPNQRLDDSMTEY